MKLQQGEDRREGKQGLQASRAGKGLGLLHPAGSERSNQQTEKGAQKKP